MDIEHPARADDFGGKNRVSASGHNETSESLRPRVHCLIDLATSREGAIADSRVLTDDIGRQTRSDEPAEHSERTVASTNQKKRRIAHGGAQIHEWPRNGEGIFVLFAGTKVRGGWTRSHSRAG